MIVLFPKLWLVTTCVALFQCHVMDHGLIKSCTCWLNGEFIVVYQLVSICLGKLLLDWFSYNWLFMHDKVMSLMLLLPYVFYISFMQKYKLEWAYHIRS